MKIKDIETALPLANRLLALRKLKKSINDTMPPSSFEVQMRVKTIDVTETLVAQLPIEEKRLAMDLINREIQALENALTALGVEVQSV